MGDEKKNARHFHIGTALIILGMIGGPLAVWGESQLERGATKEKIKQIERRQDEDRREIRERLQRIEDRAQRTDENVTQIRVILEGMKERGGR